jgi:hypothetical protein
MASERTALQIINAMEDELGLSRTTSVASTSVSARQRLAYLNNTLEEAVLAADWSGLEQEAIIEFGSPTTVTGATVDDSATVTIASTAFMSAFPTAWLVIADGFVQRNSRVVAVTSPTTFTLNKTAVASGSPTLTIVRDTFSLPSNYGRPLPQTQWDAGLMWSMIGPTSSQFDAFQRNGIVGPFPRRQWRHQGPGANSFRIFPPPTASGSFPGTLSFRYITNEPVMVAADGTTKRFFSLDSDTTVIPDRLVIMGGKWRWQQAKGFDFGSLQEEYYNWLDSLSVVDRGESVVPLDGRADYGFPDRAGLGYNVPDGSFPSS